MLGVGLSSPHGLQNHRAVTAHFERSGNGRLPDVSRPPRKVVTKPNAGSCHSEVPTVHSPSPPPERIVKRWSNSSAAVYEGDTKDGYAHGLGMRIMDNGELLFGTFELEVCSGVGIYVWPLTQSIYVGEYKSGERHGYGVLYNKTRPSLFQGMYKCDTPFGPGVMTYGDGSQDAGSWNGELLNKLECHVAYYLLHTHSSSVGDSDCTGCSLDAMSKGILKKAVALLRKFDPVDPEVAEHFLIIKRLFSELRDAIKLCEIHTCFLRCRSGVSVRGACNLNAYIEKISRSRPHQSKGLEEHASHSVEALVGRVLESGSEVSMTSLLPEDLGYFTLESQEDSQSPFEVIHPERLDFFRLSPPNVIINGRIIDRDRRAPPGPLVLASVDYILCSWKGQHVQVGKWLQSRLVHPDVADIHNCTGLLLAAIRGHYRCLETIFAYRGSVNDVSLSNMTAFSAAFHVRYCYRGLLCLSSACQELKKLSNASSQQVSGTNTSKERPVSSKLPPLRTKERNMSGASDHQAKSQLLRSGKGVAAPPSSSTTSTSSLRVSSLTLSAVEASIFESRQGETPALTKFEANTYRQIVLDDFPLCGGKKWSDATRLRREGSALTYKPKSGRCRRTKSAITGETPASTLQKLPKTLSIVASASQLAAPVKDPVPVRQLLEAINPDYALSRSPEESLLERIDKTLNLLLDKGADVNICTEPEPLLFCAVRARSMEAIQFLLRHGIDPCARLPEENGNISCLHVAVHRCDEGSAGFLRTLLSLKLGLDVNCQTTPSPVAPDPRSKLSLLKTFNFSSDPAAKKDSFHPGVLDPLDKEEIMSLFETRTPLETALLPVMPSWTPLHMLAAQEQNQKWAVQMAEDLLNNGAHPDELTSLGHSPLSIALHSNNVRLVKLLLDKGADVDLKLGAGICNALCTLFTFKSMAKRSTDATLKLARLLVERGASVLGELEIPEHSRASIIDYSLHLCDLHKDVMNEPYESMTPEDRHLHTTTLKLREYIMTVYRDQAVEAEYRRLKKLYEDTLHRISMKQTDTDGGVQGKSPFDSSKLEASKGLDEFETMTKYVQYLKEHGYFQPSWLNSVMSGYLENLKLGHDKNSEERQWLHAALHLSDLDTHKSPHESARRRRRRSFSKSGWPWSDTAMAFTSPMEITTITNDNLANAIFRSCLVKGKHPIDPAYVPYASVTPSTGSANGSPSQTPTTPPFTLFGPNGPGSPAPQKDNHPFFREPQSSHTTKKPKLLPAISATGPDRTNSNQQGVPVDENTRNVSRLTVPTIQMSMEEDSTAPRLSATPNLETAADTRPEVAHLCVLRGRRRKRAEPHLSQEMLNLLAKQTDVDDSNVLKRCVGVVPDIKLTLDGVAADGAPSEAERGRRRRPASQKNESNASSGEKLMRSAAKPMRKRLQPLKVTRTELKPQEVTDPLELIEPGQRQRAMKLPRQTERNENYLHEGYYRDVDEALQQMRIEPEFLAPKLSRSEKRKLALLRQQKFLDLIASFANSQQEEADVPVDDALKLPPAGCRRHPVQQSIPSLKPAENSMKLSIELVDCDSYFNQCYHCGKRCNVSLKACIQCKVVKYCNRECKSASWTAMHSKECFDAKKFIKTLELEQPAAAAADSGQKARKAGKRQNQPPRSSLQPRNEKTSRQCPPLSPGQSLGPLHSQQPTPDAHMDCPTSRSTESRRARLRRLFEIRHRLILLRRQERTDPKISK